VSLSAKCDWDLAAGVLLVEEAGGVVTDHHGHAFRFNLPNPRFPSLSPPRHCFTPSSSSARAA